MAAEQSTVSRYFVTYSGVGLPLNLISPVEEDTLKRRLTYFRGYYDGDDRLVAVEKIVYGEVEFEHRYEYHPDGRLKSAEVIEADEEPRVMTFDD